MAYMINVSGFKIDATSVAELQAKYNAIKSKFDLKGETARVYVNAPGKALRLVRTEVVA